MRQFLALLVLPLIFFGGQRAAGSVTIQLLAFNDFHGNLEPPSGSNGLVNAIPAGGAQYLATHLSQAIAQNPNSIIVSAGDVIGASPLVSSLSHDAATVEAMNAMRLAISSVGNHEFDRGAADLVELQREARFEYLAANVVDRAKGATLFPATAVRTIAGVKIGFIGETLRSTPAMVRPSGIKGIDFLDEAETANTYAARLKAQGAEAIVLLLHQGGRQQVAAGATVDPDGCENFSGGIEPIVSKLTADIQVVVSGHTHLFYNCRLGDHLVTSAGSFGRMITRVALTVDRSSGKTTAISAHNEIVSRDVPADPAVAALIAKYAALAEQKAAAIVGGVTADIVRRSNDAGESPLGDVVADIILDATRAPENGGAAVALMNSGGIRADLTARPARPGAAAGSVSYRDLFAVQPFGNFITVVTMTGEALKGLLEQQFEGTRRNVLQVSSGFTYRYRSTAPPGQRVERDSMAINGRHIAPADRIRVASLDFLTDGGSGFSAFANSTDRVVGLADIDAMVAYFKAHSPVAPGAADRIVRIE